jgi:hypothetical protein
LDRGIHGSRGLDHVSSSEFTLTRMSLTNKICLQVMNAKRDAEMNAAVAPAEKASQMLVEGFKKIPNELRVRYPTEMSRIGNVPSARLAVGKFGRDVLMTAAFGQRGENLNDAMMMKKIADNEREIGGCMAVVNEQIQLMKVVQARIEQDMKNAVAKPKATATAMPIAPPPAQAALPPPPAAVPAPTMLELISPHIVDEYSQTMMQHQIISVPAGATVRLVRGTLSGGLGAPYNDYIEVDYQGKVGKISRLIVRPAGGGGGGVPPAIF